MPLVFEVVFFNFCNNTDWVKHSNSKGSALPSVSGPRLASTTHRVGQACRQNQFGTPCSLTDAPQGPQRPGKAPWLVILQRRKKAAYKSRPSHLVSSAWCLWIVHECGFAGKKWISVFVSIRSVFQNTVTYSYYRKMQRSNNHLICC